MKAAYQPQNKIRIVTATSLFDGHDAAINIMRRIMQASGAEVIHLGHNRSVMEIVDCAIQEDVHAIAITSYQGGHMEFFKYMYDLLHEKGAGHIKLFGGGGGVILPNEIDELHQYGIAGIYSPDDGRAMGLQGMVNQLLSKADYCLVPVNDANEVPSFNDTLALARCITLIENERKEARVLSEKIGEKIGENKIPVVGITGTGGAGKSSLIDEVIRRIIDDAPDLKIAIISIDPSKRRSGGALLGDRIRMNSIHHPNVYMRSLATRNASQAMAPHLSDCVNLLKAAGADLIILETSGIGQADSQVVDHCDVALYVMTPEFGAPSQLEKIDMLDFADFVLINKSDKQGAEDALRDVKKQVQRNKQLWDQPTDAMPVFLTNASHFYDGGLNAFYQALKNDLLERYPHMAFTNSCVHHESKMQAIIPPDRSRYLAEICETIRNYNKRADEQAAIAGNLFVLKQSADMLKVKDGDVSTLENEINSQETLLSAENKALIANWDDQLNNYRDDYYVFKSRDKEIKVKTFSESLSGLRIPKIALPRFRSWEEILRWQLKENFPGKFPFAAGVFPFKRELEEPTRMFAGEGNPERTNKRFHYLSAGQPAKRLSTAFDSVTLYGENPATRPDIYGKVGNSGVSIATLDDVKKLYSGFDLCDPLTSVSMTINGPAPVLTALFLNAAIDQQCEKYLADKDLLPDLPAVELRYKGDIPDGNDGTGLKLLSASGKHLMDEVTYDKMKAKAIEAVRGTVQADILKEDQAQNTCIYSVDFSLKMMGDMQAYFIQNKVKNFYSVSISGYHIAEAGANPLTQLAFTLANGFTYVEYYLSRGMHIDTFASNLSFFFSNGIDPEFSVIGRVARIIWAKAIKFKYGGNEKSQKLKYHIQTSGRSLHAQEIEFNDIRTTLQALYGIYDNCNSLHTNAYDEAVTTPTEESVRRAMAIQLIINRELGLAKNQNPLQGSFIIEELTNLVEEAVLLEFERINSRGGVLGAMETNYQRGKIQEESMHYEHVKNSGDLPLIGVNTFLSKDGSPSVLPHEVIRSTDEEKLLQLESLAHFHKRNAHKAKEKLTRLKEVALTNGNIFEELMETVKYCSLGQITHALYEVGGKYRRSM